MDKSNTKRGAGRWGRIIVFYLIAVSASWVIRFSWLPALEGLDYLELQALFGLVALGPFTGAMAIRLIFRRKSRVRVFGGNLPKSLFMIAMPILLLSGFGVANDLELDPHLFGLYLGLLLMGYVILEEFGWRGYLEDEFWEMKPWLKYILIGFLWYVWHFNWLKNPDPVSNLIFLGICIVGSWGLGQVARSTFSVLACAAFHSLGNMMFRFDAIKEGMSLSFRLLILGICVGIWILFMRKWEKPLW